MVSIAPECRFPIIRISGFQSPDSGGNLGRNIQAQIEIEQLKHKLYLAEMERDLLKKLDEIERRDAFRK